MSKVEQYITSIPDFPKEGIIFRDITTVLGDADGFHLAVDEMTALLDGVEFDAIAGLESRGFLFGAPMAYNLHKAFIPIRKQGKLPRATSRMSYELEYGMETIEVHRDDIKPGMKIVVVDDLIATGDLGKLGMEIVIDLFAADGIELRGNYSDCGVMLFDLEGQDVHCGASGCGCAASVLTGYLLNGMRAGKWRNLLFCATGALHSPTSLGQGESIPGICHAVAISTGK